MELGKGFAFVARQQHIVTETDDYYIDLVFYNIELRCYVLIDLKMGKITHQDVGQIDKQKNIFYIKHSELKEHWMQRIKNHNKMEKRKWVQESAA